MVQALVSVYEATFHERYLDEAARLAGIMLEWFADPAGDGFFFTASDHEELIARQKDWQDNSVPSGNSLAACGLLRLGKLTGRSKFLDAATRTLKGAAPLMSRSPLAAGQMFLAADFYLGPTPELVIVADPKSPDAQAILGELHRLHLPNRIVTMRAASPSDEGRSSLLAECYEGKSSVETQPALFVCERFTCREPARGVPDILAALARLVDER